MLVGLEVWQVGLPGDFRLNVVRREIGQSTDIEPKVVVGLIFQKFIVADRIPP